jgi:hypothetical protein
VLPVLGWLFGCNSLPLVPPAPIPEQETDQYYEVNPVRDIDILFMVDDSPSMADKQGNLAKNFPAFIEELKKIPGGLPNVHIGVVSSDLGAGPKPILGGCERVGGDRGILQVKMGCGVDANSNFLVSANNGTMNNFQGDITQVFSCIARLGDQGCGFEHQLQSTRVALYESITPQNMGFLRPNAFLGIILLTDEDDCSADPGSGIFPLDDPKFMGTTASFRCAELGHLCGGQMPPIANYTHALNDCTTNDNGTLIKVDEIVQSVRAVKARPDQQIIVAAITGLADNDATAQYRYGPDPTNMNANAPIDYLPICHGGPAATPWSATASIRIRKFVESFGANGSLHSICADDFSPAMKQIGEKLAAVVGTPCISAPLVDTKPDPGVQADCQVIDKVPSGSGFMETPLPNCDTGKTPCWKLAPDPTCTESGFKMAVDRGGAMAAPGTQQAIKCRTCAKPDDPRCMH